VSGQGSRWLSTKRIETAKDELDATEQVLKYRGIEYVVVQTISKQWRWSIARDSGDDKVGFCTNRETALARAKGVIDRIVRGRKSIDEIMLSSLPGRQVTCHRRELSGVKMTKSPL